MESISSERSPGLQFCRNIDFCPIGYKMTGIKKIKAGNGSANTNF